MSAKNLDKHQRFRSKTVGFRMSPEENAELDRLIKLSGMTKQEYIIERLNNKEIVVNPNPRVFKALKNEITTLTKEIKEVQMLTNNGDAIAESIKVLTHFIIKFTQ